MREGECGSAELTITQGLQQYGMAKKFDTLTDLSDLGSDVTIAFDRIPDTMNGKFQKAINDILKAALGQAGLKGRWRFNSIQRSPDHQRVMPVFAAKAITEVRGGKQKQGIKVTVKATRDRKSCFEGVLIPPDGVDTPEAFHKLVGGPGEGKSSIPTIREAREDEIFIGRVASMTNYGAFITIFPDNPARMQEALCHTSEICHRMLDKPEQELRRGQLVRVVCVGHNEEGKPKLSRKRLLPAKDDFNPRPKNGVLSMKGFTGSDERIAFALNVIRESIETHSTKLAWAKVEPKGVVGGVFLEGSDLAFAPTCLVLEDLAEGILRQWRAKKAKLSGLIRYLSEQVYIWISVDRSKENSVGYAMTEDGYKFLGLTPPPLPEYYEPPAVRMAERTLPEVGANATIAMTTPSDAAPFDITQFDGVLDRIDEYEAKQRRLDEINEQLKGYDDLVAERQQVSEWLEQHSDVPAQAKLAEQLHQRLANRYDKPQQ